MKGATEIMDIKKIKMSDYIRSFAVKNNGTMSIFLGSGSSVQAGIPTGQNLIWEFKREIYCTENSIHKETLKDLQSSCVQTTLQNYFNAQGGNPPCWDSREYSHYFEKFLSSTRDREIYMQKIVRDIQPSLGHLCLGEMIVNGKIENVWTTNFDGLIEAGIDSIKTGFSYKVISSVLKNSIAFFDQQDRFPCITKLHGDYRYDKIQNTIAELQQFETEIYNKFTSEGLNGGLAVFGYSGCDDSVMNAMENILGIKDSLPYGITWFIRKGTKLNNRGFSLMQKACEINELSGIVEIDSFDEAMHELYLTLNSKNEMIEKGWINYPKSKHPLTFQSTSNIKNFMRTNGFIATQIPNNYYSFETDIKTWKELREITVGFRLSVALFKGKVCCFGEIEEIEKCFKSHVKSQIADEEVQHYLLQRDESYYMSMLYDMVSYCLENDKGLVNFGKNKY